MVEEGWTHDPVTVEVASRYLRELQEKDIDTLILGCTHYPLLRSTIGQIMGEGVTLVNPAYETALELGRLLKEQDMPVSYTHLEGLVVMIPRRGAQVANITEKDLNDVLEVRITLENMAIEKACANMTDADIRKLEQAAEVFQTSTAEGDLVKMAEADVNFHEVIYEAADNKRLMQVLNNLREQIYRYRVEYLKEDESRNRLVKEHEKITRAIKERDVKAAQELSFEHLENQRMGIIQAIRAEE